MTDIFLVDGSLMLISGGQAGADRAGLDWAIGHGGRRGGWCPKGRKSEDGPLPDRYRLQETPSASYLQRTEWNVRDSCVTLILTLADRLDGGSKKTAEFADLLGKPWLHVRPAVHPNYVARFLVRHQVALLNIAGKRESAAPGVGDFTGELLSAAMQVAGAHA